ncbi:DUF86 domain-containing protein [Pseudonocardia sp. DR1-2]|uniref:HepT-like ribonuclease domain-containing protein n=1 Tax=Pseudonocardia sp. DR1-2 TaxID=2951168 RepID=UPI002044A2BC|nr:HepT-like ribonuclease domain-containing protein [Pseudonocardia sp. DR1-2]MCM3847921.1 DUF86 domain-containing protein [Pseudonocardia sp. DR1-2]
MEGSLLVRRDRERIADMLEAAEKIRVRVARGRARFDADEDVQIVLTHLIQVLGEAAARVSPELAAAHPHLPWRALAGMRNRVVHEYLEIDLEILWAAASQEVPALAVQLRAVQATEDA